MSLVRVARCLRYAFEPSQGIGWSMYQNPEWVRPMANIGTLVFFDENKIQRSIVVDRNDRKVWELATYDRVTHNKPAYTDKDESDFDALSTGTEIECEIHTRQEDAGPGKEDDSFEVDMTQLQIRPQDDDNKGASGYNSRGLRNAQEVDLEIYMDGERYTPDAITEDLPDMAEAVFSGVKCESQRAQFLIRFAASEFRLTTRKHNAIIKPKLGTVAERTMSEWGYQDELSIGKKAWVTSYRFLLYDRANAYQLPRTYVTAIDGPDEISGSAFLTTADTPMVNNPQAGAYTVIIWTKGGVDVELGQGGPAIPLTAYGDSINGWQMYYAKSSASLPALNITPGSWFDFRLYNKHISDSALAAYYRDMNNNEGRAYIGVS